MNSLFVACIAHTENQVFLTAKQKREKRKACTHRFHKDYIHRKIIIRYKKIKILLIFLTYWTTRGTVYW